MTDALDMIERHELGDGQVDFTISSKEYVKGTVRVRKWISSERRIFLGSNLSNDARSGMVHLTRDEARAVILMLGMALREGEDD